MNNKQTKSFKPSGRLNSIFLWPVGLGILLVLLDILLCFVSSVAASIVAVFIVIYAFVCAMMICYFRPRIIKEIVEFSSNYSQVQRQLLYELSIPYCLLDNKGNILWMNASMQASINRKNDLNKNISTIIPELSANVFRNFEDFKEIRIAFNDRDYRVEMKRISADIITQGVNILAKDYNSSLVAMYMFDETDINQYIQKIRDERFVVGLVYIDNYEDALESVDDVRRSLFVGLVDKRVNKYFSAGAAIIRKLEKDKYLVVFRYKFLEKLLADKFSLVEDIKSVKVGNEKTLTLSIAIGTGAADYARNYDIAKAAMDLALGRGGDQVVIKNGNNITYYGGKTQQMEKNTRVKARVKAQALKEFMSTKDRVVVMGHKITDVDALGAAIGIFRAGKTLGKSVSIVVNDPTKSIRPLIAGYVNNPDYEPSMFVDSEQAKDMVDNNTVVVVVDTNRPSYTECEELLHMTKTIVVLDHHRRGSEVIENAVLSYVEPYASSACEMVAEILQYFSDDLRIRNMEADCLYAGIMIDTNNFTTRAGVRTFEAAAFLRRSGADVTRVRKLLRDDLKSYQARAEAVRTAQIYRECYAIARCPSENLDSPTVTGAQAANELLNIAGVKASFVLTQYNNEVYISARAIDEVNVQVMMEKMGGGGHMNIAGAQVKASPDEVERMLKDIIDQEYQEENTK
mgnify:CR=1 FL=1